MPIVMTDERKRQIEDFHALASAAYPRVFTRPGGHGHVPLKIGIIADLRAAFPDFEKSVVEMFVDIYTSAVEYQKACTKAGSPRVSLDGSLRGLVTEVQAAGARKRVADAGVPDAGASEVCPKTGKVGYQTGGAARYNARRAREGEVERREAEAYRCVYCSRFHWGHKKPWSFVARDQRSSVVFEAAEHA